MDNVLLITGDTCANCITMIETVRNVCEKRNINYSIKIANEELVDKYAITNVPTTLIFKDDTLIERVVGYQPEEIFEIWLEMKAKLV